MPSVQYQKFELEAYSLSVNNKWAITLYREKKKGGEFETSLYVGRSTIKRQDIGEFMIALQEAIAILEADTWWQEG